MATERGNISEGTAIIALTRNGAIMARKVARALQRDSTLFVDRRFHEDGDSGNTFDLPLRPVIEHAFNTYSNIIVFLSVGATIRILSPLLKTKQVDPAVVCIDDAGNFCVSLISGHVGGADRLAEEVASCIGARAVVTSASHASGTLAVDLLGREFGWRTEADSTTITRASAAVINGQSVGIWQGAGESDWWPQDKPLPDNISVYPTLEDLAASACNVALVITDNADPLDMLLADKIAVVYRPRSLMVGMGCRRGVPVEELESLLTQTFQENKLSLRSIGGIGSAEIKRGEPGLEQLAERHDVDLSFLQADQLNELFKTNPDSLTSKSERAHRLVGVWGVAEPSALLTSGARVLLVNRKNTARATIAVARKRFNVQSR